MLVTRFLTSLGWVIVCEILVKIPGPYLAGVFGIAQVVDQMSLCKLSRVGRLSPCFLVNLWVSCSDAYISS